MYIVKTSRDFCVAVSQLQVLMALLISLMKENET